MSIPYGKRIFVICKEGDRTLLGYNNPLLSPMKSPNEKALYMLYETAKKLMSVFLFISVYTAMRKEN